MASIQLPGLGTGIDTYALIQQLMTIKGRRLATFQRTKMDFESQIKEITTLKNTITAAKGASGALADVDDMEIFSTSSSDKDILTISASSEANPGSHSIEINQLATSETWIQEVSTFDYETDYVGAGEFIYSYNNEERVITAIADQTTLEDFVNLINNDEDNPGVSASLLSQGGKFHLMLSGQQTGGDSQIKINTSTTETWKPDTAQADYAFTDNDTNAGLTTKISELDQLSGTLAGDETITIAGKNHAGTDVLPDTVLSITANTTVGHLINAINDHFDGTATARLENGQIWLTDNLSGTSGLEFTLTAAGTATLGLPTMAVSTEGGAIAESLTSLSSSSFIETQNAQSSEVKIDGYPSSTTAEIQTMTPNSTASGGTYTLTYKGQTTTAIDYNAQISTIQSEIDALSNVTPGDITVAGNRLSQAGGTTFTFLAAAGDVEMISIDDSSITYSGTAGTAIVETTKGNEGWINRNGNSISDALTGITFNLHDVTEADTPIEITVTRNIGAIASRVQSMANMYNTLHTLLEEETEYNAENKKMGILSNNMAVSFIKAQIRNPFLGIIDGFVDTKDSFVQASDLGITFDGDGKMEVDHEELANAMSDDYLGVLELLGATKSGNTDSTVVQFYGASDEYTTAGTYNVKVVVSGGQITSAQIKLASESTYRNATSWGTNVINFDSTFDEDTGKPVYPENSLQLSVVLSNDGTYGTDGDPIVVQVKQGMAGALEDILNTEIKVGGNLEITSDILDDKILAIERRIKAEQDRLEKEEDRLIEKFARLERTMTMLQQQMGAVSMISNITFG